MQRETTLVQLQTIFRLFFRNQFIELTKETTTDDIDYWDSLTHLELISEIENHFNVHFSLDEVLQFKNVGDMIECLSTKINS